MNNRIPYFALPALLLACAAAGAAEPQGSITLLAPAEGAVVSTSQPVTIKWEAVWGPEGNHLHVYLDARRMDVVREAKGSDDIRILLPGKHQICLAIETRGHEPTGVQKCVEVTAK